jgi:hypothetical protein
MASSDPTSPARRVLRDATLDHTLVTEGFVRLPGVHLSAEEAHVLRDFFLDEFTGERTGFHNDFFLPDPEFRARATQLMAATTYHLAEEWFVDHRPFLYTYLTKFASENSSLLEHRDWMYVNELSGERSYILYVAIDSADEGNGMLHLVPRSHLLDGPPCGTRLTWPWLNYSDVLRNHAVPIPLQAGEAAIWDNRLIHMSFENTTRVDRVAMGLWCHRAGGELAHFVAHDKHRTSRFDVDEWFFMSQTPPQLAEHDPAYPVAEQFQIVAGDHDEEILEHVLSTGTWPATARRWSYEPLDDRPDEHAG